LEAKGGKLLLLAGTDRLDKELMIGQMQGWFLSLSYHYLSIYLFIPIIIHLLHTCYPLVYFILFFFSNTLHALSLTLGKYQLQVLPDAGHFIHEDQPAKTAQILVDFYKRNDRSALVLPPKIGDMMASHSMEQSLAIKGEVNSRGGKQFPKPFP
jgi:protein phosphatase methylesterase 1